MKTKEEILENHYGKFGRSSETGHLLAMEEYANQKLDSEKFNFRIRIQNFLNEHCINPDNQSDGINYVENEFEELMIMAGVQFINETKGWQIIK